MAEEKRFPIGPGPEEKKSGIGSLLRGLLGRAKPQSSDHQVMNQNLMKQEKIRHLDH